MPVRVLIIDYGMGNLRSVERSLHRMEITPIISSDPAEISKADKIILPGVGHFKKAMENLCGLRLIDSLHEFALVKQKPILGICLGMQLLASSSEEGNVNGLDWIKSTVIKFKVTDSLHYKIPHIGWNKLNHKRESMLLKNIREESEFYFLHSFHYKPVAADYIVSETTYEFDFPSVVQQKNIFGVQFHSEKSQEAGNILLNNFIQL